MIPDHHAGNSLAALPCLAPRKQLVVQRTNMNIQYLQDNGPFGSQEEGFGKDFQDSIILPSHTNSKPNTDFRLEDFM